MKRTPALTGILIAISVLTILSGAFQMIWTHLLLHFLSAEVTVASVHFFGIVGMFMLLFGGMLLQTLLSQAHSPVVVFWAGLQKIGASFAVGLGVVHAIFSSAALLVAGFDLVSGVLIFMFWTTL